MAEVASATVALMFSAQGSHGQIQKELAGAGKAGGDTAAKQFKGTFMSGLKSLAGPVAGLLSVSAAVDFFKDANAEAREAQKVGALTTQIIKSTGGAAKVTAGQVGDLAASISNKTGVDDEAIQSGANLLLTFKNVRNEIGKGNQVFDRATKAAADLSAAGFGDLNGASKQLGKALNDPVKGMTALSRSGVTFTKQQEKQVKALVKSGDVLGAQKIILGEVEGQVGGAAEASATAGDKAAVAFGNLKEQIGTALLPVVDKVANAITSDVVPAISNFVSEMQSGEGAGGKFADVMGDVFDALKTAGGAIKDVAGFINEHRTAAASLLVVMGSLVAVTKVHATVLAVQAAGGLMAMIKGLPIVTSLTKTWAAVQWVMNAALTANPIGIVVVAIAALAAGLVMAYKKSETFRDIVNGAFDAIAAAAKWLWNNALQPTIKFIIDGYGMVFEGIAKVLDALSHVPGFGWAKAAADKMHDAADAAHNMADNIKDIPDKNVKIKITTEYQGDAYAYAGGGGHTIDDNIGRNAKGTNYWRGGPTWVGEEGPEILNLPRGSQIIPNHKIDSSVGRVAGSGGGAQRVIIDFRDGRTLGGWIQDEINGDRAFAGTTRRMRD